MKYQKVEKQKINKSLKKHPRYIYWLHHWVTANLKSYL